MIEDHLGREFELHPEEDLLRDIALGKLPSESADRVVAHLESCGPCGSRFDSVDVSGDPLVAKLQAAADRRLVQFAVDEPAGSLETADFAPPALQDTSPHLASPQAGSSVSPSPNTRGKTIGGFRLLGVLGEGGFGTVYRAEDTVLHRKVALKVLRRRALELPGAQDRFLAEARALAAIHHDHVVPIHRTTHGPFLSQPARQARRRPQANGQSGSAA